MVENVPESAVAKWRVLVDRLVSLTSKARLKWKETVSDDGFMTTVGGITVSVRRDVYFEPDVMDDVSLMRVTIMGRDGKEIESFSSLELDDGLGIQAFYFHKLSNLLLTVRRQIAGTDQVLDELLSKLAADDGDF